MKKGKLTAVTGPMFSGKTTYLIQQFNQGSGAVVFKPDLDARFTKRPVVMSHDQVEIPAVLVNHMLPQEMSLLVGDLTTVMIDEVNFFTDELIPVVRRFLREGRDVYVAGLAYDSEQVSWEPMAQLVTIADSCVELTARCDGEGGACREPAIWSYRKLPKEARVKVAGADEYGAACEKHYDTLHHKPKGKKK